MKESKTQTGVLLRINTQSFSDVITNSSSEIFCRVESNNGSIDSIAKFLSTITGVNIRPAEDYDTTNYIDFWADYSAFYESEYIEDMFIKLLEHSLSTKFTKGTDFEIITTGIN